MDDSVIKVLRRNSSWKRANSKTINKTKKIKNNEFSLDDNFGVLAEEIKKRMKKKDNIKHVHDNLKKNDKAVLSNEELNNKKNIKDTVKKQLLPYLKEIQNLVIQREKYVEKVNSIDVNLDEVKASIQSIKQSYENNIRELQENINFFDESIEVINNVKGDD
jgi:DNA repair exonuclease SbcCD ATPase subunit